MPKKGRKAKKRRRFRAAARSVGRAARRRLGRRRGRSLGLVGKTGVAIAAGAPIAASALDAAQGAIAQYRYGGTLVSVANFGFWQFLNGMARGFGLGRLTSAVRVFKPDGSSYVADPGGDIPDNAWYKTSIIGGTLIAWDILISYAARKLAKVSSGVRFMGTKLTGGK